MEHHCYIALGSNLGDRWQNLLLALDRLENKVGKIVQLSQPHETEAWGFEAPPFINACVQVETAFSPEEVLGHLQQIEQKLGRVTSSAEGYHSRTVDLDIIFYGDRVLQTKSLQVPHPRMHLRRFVLDPLMAIAPEFEHPTLKASVQQLHLDCSDQTPATVLPFQRWLPPLFEKQTYCAFAGNIGSGKTTLTSQIAADYGIQGLYEKFTENPHLADFYQDPETFALKTEVFFLESRIAQLKRERSSPLVSDFWLEKSLIFSQATLSDAAFSQFKKRYMQQMPEAIIPDQVVYLRRPISELLTHIQKRGRAYEQSISPSYLQKIEAGYERKIRETFPYPIIIVEGEGENWEGHSYAYVKWLWDLARI
jgi:2-amino-4-hydroxy-6-hydroxymethyldihydropteridine diphosphokinase